MHQLKRASVIGLIVGLLVLIWGASGLAQAGLFTMEQVWNLPGPARPGYVQRLGRAGLFLCLLGGGVIVTTGLASLTTYLHNGLAFKVPIEVVTAAFNAGMYLGAFRALTPKGVPTRKLLPGAITGGIGWTVLQVLGTYLVHHFLHSDSVYGVFATVLGLLAWIYLAVEVTVYRAEINVVLARRLWPRSIVQPPLTEADRASMALQALQNQRRPEQHVEVTFDDRPSPMRRHRPERRRRQMRLHRPRMPGFLSRVARPTPAQPATGRSEAASSRSSAQVALPVTTTVNPAGLVTYIDRCPRAGVALSCQVRPSSWEGGASAVPSLVIRLTNAPALALVSSSEASEPPGVV